jgi:hypothetical protein
LSQTFREHGKYQHEIEALYKELIEITKISYKEENFFSNKYMLSSLLSKISMFAKCTPIGDIPHTIPLADVNNFYLTRLVLGENILMPETVDKSILSIAKSPQWINELVNRLNPENVGLGNYGKLAWAMLQWCMEQDNFYI